MPIMQPDHPPIRLEDLRRAAAHKAPHASLLATRQSSKDGAKDELARKEYSEQSIRERETERKGREAYYDLRNRWSKYLGLFLLLSILFQMVLTFAIGTGRVAFDDYKPFLHVVISENFLQIVGMVYIVVKFLFPTEEELEYIRPGKKSKPAIKPEPPEQFEGMDV